MSDTENNNVRMSGLGEADSNLHLDEMIEKGSTVDNNGIRFTGLGIRNLREIG